MSLLAAPLSSAVNSTAADESEKSLCPAVTVWKLFQVETFTIRFGVVDGVRIEEAGNATSSLGRVAGVAHSSGRWDRGQVVGSAADVAVSLAGTDAGSVTASRALQLSVTVALVLSGRCAPASPFIVTYQCVLSPSLVPTSLQVVDRQAFRANVAATSMLGNPVSALSMTSVSSIFGLSECIFSDVDALDPSISPMGLALGESLGAYYRGAIVYGLALYAGVGCVPPLALYFFRRATLLEDLARLRFPSILIVVVGMFHQGLATCAVSMMRLHTGALDVFLSLVALITCAGVTVCAGLISMPRRLEARLASGTEDGPSARREGKVIVWLLKISTWNMHWREMRRKGSFTRRYFFVLDDMRLPVWIAAELASSLAQGIILGVRKNSRSACEAQEIAVTIVLTVALCGAVGLRPVGSRLGQWGLVVQKAGAFGISALTVLHTFTANDVLLTAVDSIATIVMIFGTLQTVVGLVTTLLVSRRDVIKLLQKLARKIVRTCKKQAAKESRDGGIGVAHSLKPLTGEGVEEVSGLFDQRDLASVQGQRARKENRRLGTLATVCRRCVDVPWSVVRSEGGPNGHVNEVALRLELLIDAAANGRRPLHSLEEDHP